MVRQVPKYIPDNRYMAFPNIKQTTWVSETLVCPTVQQFKGKDKEKQTIKNQQSSLSNVTIDLPFLCSIKYKGEVKFYCLIIYLQVFC